ncbi:MAG: STAS domain-containing protein [Planctomycetes bacterium]|nr:STAS domain-containing protein [Planctomycetota bacterium]
MKIARTDREGVAILELSGRVVRENQGTLREEIERAVAAGWQSVALNLGGVDYVDSAGLGCIVSAQKLVQEKGGGSFAVFGASPNIEKTWKLIRLDLVVPILADEKAALDWISAQGGEEPGP